MSGDGHDHQLDDHHKHEFQQAPEAVQKEIAQDLDTGNAKKLLEDLHHDNLKIAQTTVDSQFGPCLIVDDHGHKHHGHDLIYMLHGDKKLEEEHGVTWTPDGKIHFSNGDTIAPNGVITDKNGKVIDSVDTQDSTKKAEETAAAERSAAVVTAGVSQQIQTAIATGDTATLDAARSTLESMGRSMPAFTSPFGSIVDGLEDIQTGKSKVGVPQKTAWGLNTNDSQVGDSRVGAPVTT